MRARVRVRSEGTIFLRLQVTLTNRDGDIFVRSFKQVRGLPLFFMESFGNYISFWKVADVIVSKRVQLCDKRHKKHQMHLLSHSLGMGNMSEAEQMVMAMTPPRRS